MRFASFLAVLVACGGAGAATIEWDRTPIPLQLVVGVEQQVRFDGSATVGMPADLVRGGVLRAQFVNDTAYWLATGAFEARRVAVRLDRTGEFVMFDLSAEPGFDLGVGAAEPLEVVVTRPERGGGLVPGGGAGRRDERSGLVSLIRLAVQKDVGPERLAAGRAGLVSVDSRLEDVSALYRHPDRPKVRLAVRGQWSAGGLFVTSVEAANVSREPVALDARGLRERAGVPRYGTSHAGFVAVGYIESRLAAAGEPGSSTRLYVVTEEPFDSAVALPGAGP